MNKKLTAIITIKENENFEKCFSSIKDLKCNYVFLDNLNVEKIKFFCKLHNLKYVNFPKNTDDYSLIKNQAFQECTTPWILFLDSNETFIQGTDKVLEHIQLSESDCYSFCIINEYTITKETRLVKNIKKIKFENSYLESISDKSKVLDVYISTKNINNHKQILEHFVKLEQDFPSQNNLKYYLACCYLANNQIDNFISKAEEFLFLSKKNDMAQIMTNYYLAIAKCVAKKNLENAIKHIIICLLYKPDMAEFWCCLGDIFYQNNNFNKAIIFYKIATEAGSKRKKCDFWPLEIKKYKEYPNRMIRTCLDLNDNKKTYKSI